ncbi:hypothetical protein L0337_25195 [candidate division KSB1 bacterium]|nr:hypothetical protein [candidate division KSB1 bacterium]
MNKTPQYHDVMMPAPIPQKSEPEQDEIDNPAPNQATSLFGSFLWAIVLLLLFWFITGGYDTF